MSRIVFEHGEHTWRADPARAVDISIPLRFDGAQPRFFGAEAAQARTLEGDGFVGDTRRGGTCNVHALELVPHCNGTHTECIGHIVDQPVHIGALLRSGPSVAALISVQPEEGMVTGPSVAAALAALDARGACQAMIVRTLPNPESKRERDYDLGAPPPWMSVEAIACLVAAGIEHVLVDLPSLDPMHDEGRLAAHRTFWGLPPGSRDAAQATRPQATITEMIYVPDVVSDGLYLLDLQIPAFLTDAAPSRPLIYPLEDA